MILVLPPSLSGPPSAPRNAISNVNETSVFLEWSVPTETGGRKDVRYNILCRRVLPDGRGSEECGPNVRFLPRRVGLSNTSVMVADLQSHTNYSFLVEAVNGVSELAREHARQYVSLNVTTNQAGMLRPHLSQLTMRAILQMAASPPTRERRNRPQLSRFTQSNLFRISRQEISSKASSAFYRGSFLLIEIATDQTCVLGS